MTSLNEICLFSFLRSFIHCGCQQSHFERCIYALDNEDIKVSIYFKYFKRNLFYFIIRFLNSNYLSDLSLKKNFNKFSEK